MNVTLWTYESTIFGKVYVNCFTYDRKWFQVRSLGTSEIFSGTWTATVTRFRCVPWMVPMWIRRQSWGSKRLDLLIRMLLVWPNIDATFVIFPWRGNTFWDATLKKFIKCCPRKRSFFAKSVGSLLRGSTICSVISGRSIATQITNLNSVAIFAVSLSRGSITWSAILTKCITLWAF